jgi:hypothetical protein
LPTSSIPLQPQAFSIASVTTAAPPSAHDLLNLPIPPQIQSASDVLRHFDAADQFNNIPSYSKPLQPAKVPINPYSNLATSNPPAYPNNISRADAISNIIPLNPGNNYSRGAGGPTSTYPANRRISVAVPNQRRDSHDAFSGLGISR